MFVYLSSLKIILERNMNNIKMGCVYWGRTEYTFGPGHKFKMFKCSAHAEGYPFKMPFCELVSHRTVPITVHAGLKV
jgi:hypothetical protein